PGCRLRPDERNRAPSQPEIVVPEMRTGSTPLGLVVAGLLSLAFVGLAQRSRFREPEEAPRPAFASGAEFHFIRLEYTDLPQYHRRFGFASRAGRGEGWW